MGAGFGVLAIIVIVAGVLFDRLVQFLWHDSDSLLEYLTVSSRIWIAARPSVRYAQSNRFEALPEPVRRSSLGQFTGKVGPAMPQENCRSESSGPEFFLDFWGFAKSFGNGSCCVQSRYYVRCRRIGTIPLTIKSSTIPRH